MLEKPDLSVITVVYNDADNLEKTIRSVVSQKCQNLEYIVIDGGSTDGSLDIIEKYSAHISYCKSEPDKGIYDAMNKGIKVAKGRYVNFLNAGDIYFGPDTLSTVKEKIKNNANIDVLYGQAVRLSGENSNLKFVKGGEVTVQNLFTSIPFCHQALFYRTSLFKEIGPYDTTFKVTADYQWLIRYYNRSQSLKKMVFMDRNVVEYLEGGYSFQNMRKAAREKIRIAWYNFPGLWKCLGLVSSGWFLLKIRMVMLLGRFNLLHAYRSIKYKLLGKTITEGAKPYQL